MKSTIHKLQISDNKVLSKTSKYLLNKFQLLMNSKKTTGGNFNSNELTDPRFQITSSDENTETSKSLLFLMYSEENQALFI